MRYIRRIDNPLLIKASGCVGPGGLGEFDPAIYEEVAGELPEDWEAEQPTDLAFRLAGIFDSQPVSLRARFAPLRVAVKLELDLDHADVAREIIVQAEIPPELEPLRQELLACFDAP
jgi:hypothetical protein